ncbi:hypothetical protein [Streptomyces scopuliridis]|uniref:hypothetical protein n=1 Tax=Streptomyces scopuliridis TaxID=452529 RepID=UPI0035DA7861
MTISPARITEIRDLMNSEHRTHDQLDAVVEELLEDAERTPTDPTADLLRQITELRTVANTARALLRQAAYRIQDGRGAVDTEQLLAASDEIVEILTRHT